MGLKRTDEFHQDAVRITLTLGLTHKQVADDPGIGMSTLDKWIMAQRDTDVMSREDLGLAQESDRLRCKNRILKEERVILKKPRCSSRAKSREVSVHRKTPVHVFYWPDVSCHERQLTWSPGIP